MLDKLIDLIVSLWNRINPVIFIYSYERGVMFRAGKFIKVLKPGLHLRLSGIDVIKTQNVVNKTICIREVNVTTKDFKSVSIAAKFNVIIVDVYKCCIMTDNWAGNIVDVGRGIIQDKFIDYNWDEICSNRTVHEDIGKKIIEEGAEIGIQIYKFQLTDKLGIFGIKTFNS